MSDSEATLPSPALRPPPSRADLDATQRQISQIMLETLESHAGYVWNWIGQTIVCGEHGLAGWEAPPGGRVNVKLDRGSRSQISWIYGSPETISISGCDEHDLFSSQGVEDARAIIARLEPSLERHGLFEFLTLRAARHGEPHEPALWDEETRR